MHSSLLHKASEEGLYAGGGHLRILLYSIHSAAQWLAVVSVQEEAAFQLPEDHGFPVVRLALPSDGCPACICNSKEAMSASAVWSHINQLCKHAPLHGQGLAQALSSAVRTLCRVLHLLVRHLVRLHRVPRQPLPDADQVSLAQTVACRALHGAHDPRERCC